MSCKAFLRSFAYQYCRHKYIRKVVRFLSPASIKKLIAWVIIHLITSATRKWLTRFWLRICWSWSCVLAKFDKNLTATINQEKLLRLPCSLLLWPLSRPLKQQHCHETSLAEFRNKIRNEWMKFSLHLMQWLIKSTIPTPNQWYRKWSFSEFNPLN